MRRRAFRPLLATCAIALGTACSDVNVGAFNVVYAHADWLAQKTIARYADLDESQRALLQTQLRRLHHWHRARELPLYADLVDELARRVSRHLTAEDTAWIIRVIDERRQAIALRAADDLAPVLVTLTAEQRSQIAAQLARDNARFERSQLDPGPQRTVRSRSDWLVGQMEHWIGPLTSSQRIRIAMVSAATVDFPAARLAERRRRQQVFLQLIGSTRDEALLRPALASLLALPRKGADESYGLAVTRYEEELKRMIVDIDASLSADQRDTASARLHRFAGALRERSADPP